MTNEKAIEKALEILVKYDDYDFEYTLDIGKETDAKIGPIYYLMFYRPFEENPTDSEWTTAKLFRKIYFLEGENWDSDETKVKEFDIKQIKRDYKLGLLGIKKNDDK